MKGTFLRVLVLCVLTLPGQLQAQSVIGAPKITHFTRDDYHADSKFWGMAEDSNRGILYFGNSDGVNIYDGEFWHLVKMPKRSTVRSLLYGSDMTLYVGGSNEFGKITRDQYGKYRYESLIDLLPQEERNFSDIWQIQESHSKLILRTFKKLIIIDGQNVTSIPAKSRFETVATINNEVYTVDADGLKKINPKSLTMERLLDTEKLQKQEICNILPGTHPNEILLFSKPGYLFRYDIATRRVTSSQDLLGDEVDQIFCALKAKSGTYYLGMVNNQIRALEPEGLSLAESREIQNLQDNTVLSLYETSDGNLWALLNRGIDCIETSSPTTIAFDGAGIYDALIDHSKMYLATNQGVYLAETSGRETNHLDRRSFQLIKGLEAQAWSMTMIDGQIMVSHDRGAFIGNDQEFYHVPGTNGIWKIIPLGPESDQLLACAYDGLYILDRTQSGRYFLKNKIAGFELSAKEILPTNSPRTFWICHWQNGIYMVKLDEELTRLESIKNYTEQNGLPSNFNIKVTTWGSDTIFLTDMGVYQYHKGIQKFAPHIYLSQVLGKTQGIQKIVRSPDKTWFIKAGEMGYFHHDSTNHSLHQDNFLEFKDTFIETMEFFHPTPDGNNLLIGTDNGLYLYDLGAEQNLAPAKTLFSAISYINPDDSLVRLPLIQADRPLTKVPYGFSQFKFRFTNDRFYTQKNVQYSYLLDGMQSHWSPWSGTPIAIFDYLKSGRMTLKVKSRSLMGDLGEEAIYPFEVMPVWYRSLTARLVYLVLILSGATGMGLLMKRKINKTRTVEQKRRKLLELEIERMKLQREKERIEIDKKLLEEDVIFKSKELANYTMLLVRKRELLTDLREDLKELKEVAKNETSRNMLRNLIRKIGFNLSDEEHIHVFEANFERVHHEFFQELKTHFPDLTSKELRLCALVKMNLTNKEIAPILNISLRGVETARYRLRKRLSLGQEDNMVEFLEKLAP